MNSYPQKTCAKIKTSYNINTITYVKKTKLYIQIGLIIDKTSKNKIRLELFNTVFEKQHVGYFR